MTEIEGRQRLAFESMKPGRAKVKPKTDGLFLAYQERWIKDTSRFKIYEKSRQVGISWASAFWAVRTTSRQKCAHDCWVSSRDENQAQLFLIDCANFANILQVMSEGSGDQVVRSGGKEHTSRVLHLANGRKVHSMSSNPDAQAGKKGPRILDEFALNPQNERLYAISRPGITWGGGVSLVSTHRGTQNLFNKFIQEAKHGGNPKRASLHTTKLSDALNEGFLWRLQQLKRSQGIEDETLEMDEQEYFDNEKASAPTPEVFLEEYQCEPSDDATAFISHELFDGCLEPHGAKWEQPPQPDKSYFLGWDLARRGHLSVIVVIEENGSLLRTRRLIEMQNVPFVKQEEMLAELMNNFRIRRACIDASGLGMQLAENAILRYGTRVEQVQFTMRSKEEIAFDLYKKMEDRALRIPPDPKNIIRADFRLIRREVTSSNNVRFLAGLEGDSHADRFWAFALACHAAKSPGLGPAWVAPRGGEREIHAI